MIATQWMKSAAVLGIALALLATAGCSGRRSEQYRQEGDTYLRLEKFDEAATAYARAEQADPSNAWAKLGLGKVHLAREEYPEALTKFREAAALTPTVGGELESAVETLIRAERPTEAFALVDDFIQVDPLNGGLLNVYLLRETGQFEEAAAALVPLTESYPDAPKVWIAAVHTQLAAGRPDLAADALREALALPDIDPMTARMLSIDVYAAQGRLNEAIHQFRAAADADPADLAAKTALARSLLEAAELDEAEELARTILDAQPASPWAQYVLGSIALARQRPVDAIALLHEAARQLPRERAVLRRLAAAERAVRAVAGLQPAQPADAPETVDESLPDWQTLWRQAALRRLLEHRAEYLGADASPQLRETLTLAAAVSHQESLLAELAASLEDSSPLKSYAELLQRPTPDAIRAYFDAWPQEDGPEGAFRSYALGHALAVAGARAQAIQLLSQAYEQDPGNSVPLYSMAQIYRAAQMPDFAARVLERVVSNALDNAEAHTLLFVVLRQAGMHDRAQAAAESAYSLFPRDPQMVLNLAQAYLDAGEADLAERALERGREARPNDPALRVTLAAVLLQQDRHAEARDLLDRFTGPDALQHEARALTVFADALDGDWNAVAQAIEDTAWRRLHPATLYLAAAAYLRDGREQEARAALQEAEAPDALLEQIEAAPQSSAADAAFAAALQQRRLNRQAFDLYQRLIDEHGATPWLVENALLALRSAPAVGDRLAIAQAIAEQHPELPESWIELANIARAVKADQAEEQALARAVQAAPENVRAWQLRADFLQRNDRLAEAMEAYQTVLALTPDSAAANNNLAYCLLMTEGDARTALTHAQRAADLIPMNANILHTLGLAHMRVGDLDQAHRNFAVALELKPADPAFLLDFGLLAIKMNEKEIGYHYIELALQYASQLNLDFPRRDEALQVLSDAGPTLGAV